MKSLLHRGLFGLALAAPLALAAISYAEEGPGGAQVERRVMIMHGGGGDPAKMAEHHAQHLRDALQLRPDQEPALQAVLAAGKPAAGGPAHAEHDMDADARLTTPQRLDRMLAHLDEARAMMARHAAAVKAFYAQLSPSQQKAFDAVGPMMMGGHHGGPGMGMEMGGPGNIMIMRRHGPGPDGHGPGGPGGEPHGE